MIINEYKEQIKQIQLKRNPKKIVPKDFVSMLALFAPALLFAAGLVFLYCYHPNFRWLSSPALYPWELWAMVGFGVVATFGGVGDWIYHRLYVSAGPKERHSHLLALATGGFPLAVLMCFASIMSHPQVLLIPIIVFVLYTATLICYDEFMFHFKRCKPFETAMHRLLVFGNLIAWLAWMNWCFVRGGVYGM